MKKLNLQSLKLSIVDKVPILLIFSADLLDNLLKFLYYFRFVDNLGNLINFSLVFIILSLLFYFYKSPDQVKLFKLPIKSISSMTILFLIFYLVSRVLDLSIIIFQENRGSENRILFPELRYLAYVHFIGPVFEEITFRKIYFDFLKKYLPEKISIIILSIVFGLSHYADRSLLECVAPMFSSLMLFWILRQYKDWKYCVLFHILLNSGIINV